MASLRLMTSLFYLSPVILSCTMMQSTWMMTLMLKLMKSLLIDLPGFNGACNDLMKGFPGISINEIKAKGTESLFLKASLHTITE